MAVQASDPSSHSFHLLHRTFTSACGYSGEGILLCLTDSTPDIAPSKKKYIYITILLFHLASYPLTLSVKPDMHQCIARCAEHARNVGFVSEARLGLAGAG